MKFPLIYNHSPNVVEHKFSYCGLGVFSDRPPVHDMEYTPTELSAYCIFSKN